MIVLDTSAILALLDAGDQDHARCLQALKRETPPYLVPAGILAEIGYLAERKVGLRGLEALLDDLASGAFTLDCGENDFSRISELARRYSDLALGFADASVIACGERSGGTVMTLDRRDFDVVAREGSIAVVPPPA